MAKTFLFLLECPPASQLISIWGAGLAGYGSLPLLVGGNRRKMKHKREGRLGVGDTNLHTGPGNLLEFWFISTPQRSDLLEKMLGVYGIRPHKVLHLPKLYSPEAPSPESPGNFQTGVGYPTLYVHDGGEDCKVTICVSHKSSKLYLHYCWVSPMCYSVSAPEDFPSHILPFASGLFPFFFFLKKQWK